MERPNLKSFPKNPRRELSRRIRAAICAWLVAETPVAVSAGDFNGDGFEDLVMSVPLEDVGSVVDAGAVNILPGAATGLTATGNQVWHEKTAGIVGSPPEYQNHFGYSVADGDFNGDGFDDLAIGQPGTAARAGAVHVLYGSGGGGLQAANDRLWDQGGTFPDMRNSIPGTSEPGEEFGASLAACDFNGDGFDDIAIGVPLDREAGAGEIGGVNVLYGWSALQPPQPTPQLWNQDSKGLEDRLAFAWIFGSVVTCADFNGDDFDDLAVGAYEVYDLGPSTVVIFGSADGLQAIGSGAPDDKHIFNYGGTTYCACDFNGDSYADLAIGVPVQFYQVYDSSGSVEIHQGSASGSFTHVSTWRQGQAGVQDSQESDDHFGDAVACGDFNADGFGDLAIGASGEDTPVADAGVLHVLFGSTNGLQATGAGAPDDQLWRQNVASVLDSEEVGDRFGSGLRAADFDHDGFVDLAVAVPLEDLGTVTDAGGVNVLFGSSTGLSASRDQFWSQNSSGVLDQAESGDQLGCDNFYICPYW